jgi:predicted aconitase
VQIPTTLNSISTDRRQWKQLDVPAEYANAANALADAYLQLQCQPTFTCAPYLLLDHDEDVIGQDWVWGESNAVVYANSVLGARTNKIADYLDICGALAGIVPLEGMHCAENRTPTVLLDATGLQLDDDDDSLFPTLGHLCGSLSDGQVPLLIGLEQWKITTDHLKAFCAAFGTTGSSSLIHIAGITPEAQEPSIVQAWIDGSCHQVVPVTSQQLQETFQLLDKDSVSTKIDLIALGNPHLSVTECQKLVELVTRQQTPEKHPDVRVIACISRAIQEAASEAGHIQPLQAFGVEFVNDTCWCMLLDPPVIPKASQATILTNSGKYAHYGPGLVQRRFRFGSLADCVRTATTGVYSGRPGGGISNRSFHTGERPGAFISRYAVRLLRRYK